MSDYCDSLKIDRDPQLTLQILKLRPHLLGFMVVHPDVRWKQLSLNRNRLLADYIIVSVIPRFNQVALEVFLVKASFYCALCQYENVIVEDNQSSMG